VPDFSAVGDTVESSYGLRAAVADINGDGIPDLAVSSNDQRGFETIDVYYGHTGWVFSKNGFDQRFDSRESNWYALSSFSLVDVMRTANLTYPLGTVPPHISSMVGQIAETHT